MLVLVCKSDMEVLLSACECECCDVEMQTVVFVPSGCRETVRIRSEWFFRSQRLTTGSILSSRFTAGTRWVDTRALSQTLVSRLYVYWVSTEVGVASESKWKYMSDWFKAFFSLSNYSYCIFHYFMNISFYSICQLIAVHFGITLSAKDTYYLNFKLLAKLLV